MKIEFPRGDSYERGFLLRNKTTGQPITDTFEEIYFTVKKYTSDADFLFQKKMTTGGIVHDGEGHYTLYIRPSDTDGLPFGEYICDIELVKDGGEYKKTFFGSLELTRESTASNNE